MTEIEKAQALINAKGRSGGYEVIYSYKNLARAMCNKYGADWRYHVVYNYGPKQLGL